jgi:hypothetical protein
VAEADGSRQGLIDARERMQALTRAHPDVPWGYLEVAELYRISRNEYHNYLARDWTNRAAQAEDTAAWRALEQRFQPVRSCAEILRP